MDKIAVLDFGGQYAHLIANRVRRLGVYSEIVDGETPAKELVGYKALILSGGPASVYGDDSARCDLGIFDLEVPILGICYGHQLIAHSLGGRVDHGKVREYGHAIVKFSSNEAIFDGLDPDEDVWMSHFDQVVEAPKGFEVVGSTEDCPIAAMMDKKRNIYSLQFHPEVTHTSCGMDILRNFVDITDSKREWDLDKFLEEIKLEIKEKVGGQKVFMLISGGVDSTVAFVLLSQVLGEDNIYGLFVDTGFMRMNEKEEVENALAEAGIKNLHVYDAKSEYFEALKGVYEPEKKRIIIGDLFLDIQEKVSNELGLNPEEWIIGQGTIYPDTIETGGTKRAHKIKTHHNRVERVQKLIEEGRVIEPLAQLYKDEVRAVGEKLGLAKEIVWRHPFPGPGLAVRCLCTEGEDLPGNNEELETRINDLISDNGIKGKILPIKSVGVQGDERTYRHPVLLYSKELDWGRLNTLSTRLTNHFAEVNRALYCISPDEINTLTSRDSYLDQKRVLIIQEADKVVMDYIYEVGIDRDIWQFPTVLIPVIVNNSGKESIVLRPVCSSEAMTANFYRMNEKHLKELKSRLEKIEEVGAVFYDITNKPPGTIEWE